MADLTQARIVVVGAGVLGAAAAFAFRQAGAHVTLVDPSGPADNASGIAAGMLAPAFEALLDPVSVAHFPLLAKARDLWPAFVEHLGPTGLDRCGALLIAPPATVREKHAALSALGAAGEVVAGPNGREVLYTPEDWRIEPRLALAALRQALLDGGGEVVRDVVAAAETGAVTLGAGRRIGGDVVVLACGYGGLSLAPELGSLTPIKGQLLRFADAGPRDGPILRSATGYVAPGRDGAIAGATMEPGMDNLAIDSDAVERLRAAAVALVPALAAARADPRAGVRAATPDGLPLVGQSLAKGVFLASGARRNGWLLAPMVARLLVRQLAGEEGGKEATLFAPDRFSPAA